MAAVTTCPYCKRTVGLMTGRPTPSSFPRSPRIALHSVGEPGTPGRKRCLPGSALEVDPADIREVAARPSGGGLRRTVSA